MTTDATKGTTPEALDERLMALADGELDGDEARALRARIAADPNLAERFALFVETRALLAADHGPADAHDESGLARLAAAIHAADRAVAAAEAPRERRFGVVEGGGSSRPASSAPPRPRFHVAAPALAASLALAVGGVLGYGLGRQGGAPGGGEAQNVVAVASAPAAAAAASRALQSAASGEAVVWTDGAGLKGAVTVLSSHRLGDDGVCREYEVTVEGRDDKAVALGCRTPDGWRTELAARAGGGEGYAKASGASVAEAALADLGSSGAMTPEEEAALIKDGWPARK